MSCCSTHCLLFPTEMLGRIAAAEGVTMSLCDTGSGYYLWWAARLRLP